MGGREIFSIRKDWRTRILIQEWEVESLFIYLIKYSTEFKRINYSHGDFRGNRSQLIRTDSLNITSEIWRRLLRTVIQSVKALHSNRGISGPVPSSEPQSCLGAGKWLIIEIQIFAIFCSNHICGKNSGKDHWICWASNMFNASLLLIQCLDFFIRFKGM